MRFVHFVAKRDYCHDCRVYLQMLFFYFSTGIAFILGGLNLIILEYME